MSLAPNVRVNAIAPGPTIKNQRQSEKHFKKQYLATPLKRQVGVEQICNAVDFFIKNISITCLLYTSPSPRDGLLSRMPSSA